MWIFGYGSLMWRVGFTYLESRPSFVTGYRRRFWQASTDHRGLPHAPGRVVTLVPSGASPPCWGIAYRIDEQRAREVLAGLDHREKNGYARVWTPVHAADGAPFARALAYVARRDNPSYLGCAPLAAIAEQVIGAEGPSGSNADYVLALADALRAIDAEDHHVFRLEALVRAALAGRA